MAYKSWLLVMLLSVCPVFTQGDELCYEDSWRFYGRLYSCFKRISTSLTWTAARDYCLQMQLGSIFGVTTRLAKIDDGPTNGFVRGLCALPYSPCWIGMHYNDEKGDFRWDGYPDEEPSFRSVIWPDPQGPYVATMNDRWDGFGGSQTHHFVCGHGAKKISDVTCEDHLVDNGLRITCTSQKSPIQGACQWTYNYDGSNNFPSWQWVDGTAVSSNESQTEPGDISFITVCWLTLTSVNPSPVTIKMKMYADPANGPDLSGRNDVITVGRITIDIVPPDRPVFKLLHKTLQTSSVIHFSENDRIYLTCEVPSGKPSVNSVTLICEFPFTNSGVNNSYTVQGITYVMDEIASRDMNGKNCKCLGNHVTGEKESLLLTFNVTYPAEVKDFTVNGQPSSLVVDLDESLTFSCLTDGNPLPSVSIQKLGISLVDTSALLSRATGMEVEHVLEASCDHNGRYRCSAVNVENQLEDIQDLDVRVRCTPNFCNEISRDLRMVVKPGESETVSLCVVAYPMPSFTLMKNSNTGWQTPEDLVDHVTQETSLAFQKLVTISFQELSPSHLGAYALQYSGSTSSSWLYFNLTAPLTPCKGQESVIHDVTLGQSASIHLCVTAFPRPSRLVMQKGSSCHDYRNPKVTISMELDFDTLTSVRIFFLEVNAMDIGEYHLFDPQEVNGSLSPYLSFSLSDVQRKGSACSSSLSTGAIIGLILASDVVVVILTITIMTAFRKLRTSHHRKTSGNGRTNGGFHKPEQEGNYSGYVDVNETAMMPGKTVHLPSPKSVPEKSIYEGEELQATENTEYETVRDVEDGEKEGTKKRYYSILHPDDPNYTNLNQEPLRQYVTVDPGDQAPRSVYHVPKSTA